MSGFKPRAATVTLYGGDYEQRIGHAKDAVKRARESEARPNAAPRTADDLPESVRLEREHDALVEEANAEASVVVTLQALSRKAWRQMVTSNPPREGNEGDASLGVNDETLGDALVPVSIVKLSESDVTVPDLLDMISSAQFDLLYGTSFALNRSVDTAPKERYSAPSPNSSATSS